jgi:hypothetical protein
MKTEHVVKILANGKIHFIYSDQMSEAMKKAGVLSIFRASHVEPNKDGKWVADMSPVKGPKLGPFSTREKALCAEVQWLEKKYLGRRN